MAHYYALIAAAGESTRFASVIPKQYHKIKQKTVLEKSINTFLSFKPLKKLVIILHPNDQYWQTLPCAHHPKIATTHGGSVRTESVLNGLRYLSTWAKPDDWILVHDAARPFLTLSDLSRLIDATKDHPVGGILATPVVDTLKYSSDGKHIEKTIPRQNLYRALTPQCFRFKKLVDALTHSKNHITDEAMALEMAGYESLLVLGDPKNDKITYFGDEQI